MPPIDFWWTQVGRSCGVILQSFSVPSDVTSDVKKFLCSPPLPKQSFCAVTQAEPSGVRRKDKIQTNTGEAALSHSNHWLRRYTYSCPRCWEVYKHIQHQKGGKLLHAKRTPVGIPFLSLMLVKIIPLCATVNKHRGSYSTYSGKKLCFVLNKIS